MLSFLKTRTAGDIVSEHDILSGVPSWKKVTLDTYRKKHKLSSSNPSYEWKTWNRSALA
ncbi:MAG TPA: hypothetical protein VJV79_33520 [Polyangiaceae bacterium]|nr:hypothetical protein [Polyangiaceae bacterium]